MAILALTAAAIVAEVLKGVARHAAFAVVDPVAFSLAVGALSRNVHGELPGRFFVITFVRFFFGVLAFVHGRGSGGSPGSSTLSGGFSSGSSSSGSSSSDVIGNIVFAS